MGRVTVINLGKFPLHPDEEGAIKRFVGRSDVVEISEPLDANIQTIWNLLDIVEGKTFLLDEKVIPLPVILDYGIQLGKGGLPGGTVALLFRESAGARQRGHYAPAEIEIWKDRGLFFSHPFILPL